MTNNITLQQCLDNCIEQLQGSDVFFGHGTNNAVDEAYWIVLSALDISPQTTELNFSMILEQSDQKKVLGLLEKRISSAVPTAYLTGEAWFYGQPFYVSPDVLIPRSPIAELISEKFSPWLPHAPERVLDLCTGSGCIGIATALEFESALVTLTDISREALLVAIKNVSRHELQQRVKIVQSDLFSRLGDQEYDLIICNPPYVSDEEMSELPKEYLHEPDLGLRAGAKGLDIVKRVFAGAAKHMADGSVLIMEVGNSEQAVINEWPEVPFTWLEFEHGGHGVLLLTKEQLLAMPEAQ